MYRISRIGMIMALTVTVAAAAQQPVATTTDSASEAPPAAVARPAPPQPTAAPRLVKESREQMATVVVLMAYAADEAAIKAAFDKAFDEIERLDALMSSRRPSSLVLALNQAAGAAPIPLRPEVVEVLGVGLEMAQETNGAFDVSWAALRPLWRFDDTSATRVVPTAEAIAQVLPLVNWRKITLDRAAGTAALTTPQMAIDLGGLARGYAADRALAVLHAAGLRNCLVYVGGDIVASGSKGSLPWVVGIQDPRGPGYFATMAARDVAVVTSGDYERYFEAGGKRYHHILDPRTGYPATGVRSVTVIAPNGTRADALATALFVQGVRAALQYAEAHDGVEVLLVDDRNQIHLSPGLKQAITIHRSPSN